MLRLDDVHVHIGKLHILQGVSLEVKAGECVALLGRNGVGKTTTLRAIMGLARLTRGSVAFDGRDLARCRAARDPAAGDRVRAPGARHLSQPDRPGKPEHRPAGQARRRARGLRVRVLSPAQGTPRPVGRHAVGRRAADAGDRALPDDAAQADHPRRADRRHHAAAGLADQARDPSHQPERRLDLAGRAERARRRSSCVHACF